MRWRDDKERLVDTCISHVSFLFFDALIFFQDLPCMPWKQASILPFCEIASPVLLGRLPVPFTNWKRADCVR
jgi:hypothetical protein